MATKFHSNSTKIRLFYAYLIPWSSDAIIPQRVNTKDIQYASEVVVPCHQAKLAATFPQNAH